MARGDGGAIAEEGELFQTHIGGSALTEGVMMRGKLSWAVAVREPDGGIYVEEHELAGAADGSRARAWYRRCPVVRGCVSFVESMALSMRAMGIAADHAYGPDGESWADLCASVEAGPGPSAAPRPASVPGDAGAPAGEGPEGEADGDGPSGSLSMALSVALGIALGVALFVALPVVASNLIVGPLEPGNAVAWNLVEAAVRIALLVAYVAAVGLMPDMARVFGYHGAEHQSIHCFEHGVALTPENAARFSRIHVRCGTAFLVMTVAVAIVVNTLVPVASAADALGLSGAARGAFVFLSRLAMLPLVAGVSYEVTVKWAGSHPDSPLVRAVLWPGLQMQRLTTRVPDPGMLECAIAALRRVRATEEAAGLPVPPLA